MFSIRTIILIGLLYLPCAGAEIPVGTPSSRNILLVARELYGRGLLENFEYSNPSSQPAEGRNRFEKELVENYRHQFDRFLPHPTDGHLEANLEFDGISRQSESNSSYLKMFPRVALKIRPNLEANIEYRVDGELPDDSRYEGKSWRGWAGFAENAAINLSIENMDFRFGIERTSWGYGRYGNLFFSYQAMPMALFGFSYRSKKVDFEWLNGFLSPLHEELYSDIPGYISDQQRYIAAHSLTLKPFKGFSVSLREAVVYGGPGRRFEPAYAFPLIWYHGYQLNSGINDNTLAGMGLDYRSGGRFWFYGELMVDDFQIEKKSAADNEPNQLAGLIGFEIYDIALRGSTLGAEYVRVDNWVYNQPLPHNRYINRNFPIGFPDGPDNDMVDWELSAWFWKDLRISYSGSFQRAGEGRIDSYWSAPWLYSEDYSEPFPSGVVRKTLTNGLEIMALNKMGGWGKLGFQLADINNVDNYSGRDRRNWELSIEIGYNSPPVGWGFK